MFTEYGEYDRISFKLLFNYKIKYIKSHIGGPVRGSESHYISIIKK